MKKITFLICLLLFSIMGLHAQIITIGTGTSTQRYPLGSYYGYERSASIYTASEIGGGGNIVNLAWQADVAGTARPVVIYLVQTTSSTLTAGTWANQISGATQVYSGSVTPVVGWNTINLSVPFSYSGGANNLMVLVEANYGGGGGTGSLGNSVRYSTATSQHEYWQQDNTVPTGSGTVTNSRPNIMISFDTQCSGTPVVGTVTPATQNLCIGATPATLVATGTVQYIGTNLQWEESNDNGVGDAWAPAVGGSGATTVSYSPPAFSGTSIYYRLKATCSNSGMSAQTASALLAPPAAPSTQASALNFTNVVNTSTTANWTNGNGNRRLVIMSNTAGITDPVSASGQPAITANAVYAGSGQQVVYDGTGTSVSVSGLTCNTTYYFKVYEYVRCGSDPYDYYYNVTSGTNAASGLSSQPTVATLPVNNNFAGFTGADLSTVFPGWYEGYIATAAGSVPTNSNPGSGASNWVNSSALGVPTGRVNLYGNTKNDWIISPKVLLTGPSRVRYKAAITDWNGSGADPAGMQGTDDKVDVLISTDACGSNWTVLQTFNAANTTTLTNALTDYMFDLSAYTGQTVQIAFRASDGPLDDAPDYDFHITNIAMELIPSCSQPIALGANNITSSSASLFWTAGGTETLWNVQWGPSGFTLGTGTIVSGTANPHPLSGLSPNTTYQYYVQANCQANGTSTWAGPFSFTTLCGVANVPYTQDFESVTTPALPNCTSVVNDGTGNVWTTVSAPGSGFTTKTLRYQYHSTNPANTWFFTQGINLTAGTSYRISYNYGNNSTTYIEKLKVAYGSSAASVSMTNVLADHSTINQNAIQFNQIDFTPSATGVYYFGFQAYSAIDQFSLYVDNINITLTPACSAPINLTASNVTNNSASISWGSVPSASGYQYVLDTNATDPAGSGTAITATTFNATPLSPLTTYYFHVRTDCSGTASTWSTVSFTTLPTPPANDTCANAMVLTPGGVFGDQDVSGTIYGATTTAGITPSCQASFTADVWYRVVVPASGNLTIETQGTSANSMTDSVIAAFSGTCGTLTQVGCDDDAGSGNMSLLVLTGRTPGETLYIGVWKFNTTAPVPASSEFVISTYDASLSSADFDTTAFKAYPNPVKDVLNLSYSTEIASVEVYNMLGQKVMTKTLNVAQGQIDMSNLNSGNYIINVTTGDGLTKTIKVIKQ